MVQRFFGQGQVGIPWPRFDRFHFSPRGGAKIQSTFPHGKLFIWLFATAIKNEIMKFSFSYGEQHSLFS